MSTTNYPFRQEIEDMINGSKKNDVDSSAATMRDYLGNRVKDTIHLLLLGMKWNDIQDSIADLFRSDYFIGHIDDNRTNKCHISIFTDNKNSDSVLYLCEVSKFMRGDDVVFSVKPIDTIKRICSGYRNDELDEEDYEKIIPLLKLIGH